MTKQIRVGLLGCGTVGTGVLGVLATKRELIRESYGVDLEVGRIAVRDLGRNRHEIVDRSKLSGDWMSVCTADDVDVVIEVVGGTGVAKDAVLAALRHGKPVVTANKELMAHFGESIRQTALENQVCVRCEASVLGGIPVLNTIETYFALNRIRKLRGIVNGTSNYILTRMYDEEQSFQEALVCAQKLGYSEADPAMDVDGVDAWCKLHILLDYLGVSQKMRIGGEICGIRDVTLADIQSTRSAGKKIKHLVTATWVAAGVVEWTVGPSILDESDPLFHVSGVQNALCLDGDIVGEISLLGPGAGAYPTASAVLEDVLKILPAYSGVPNSLPHSLPREIAL